MCIYIYTVSDEKQIYIHKQKKVTIYICIYIYTHVRLLEKCRCSWNCSSTCSVGLVVPVVLVWWNVVWWNGV